LDNSSAAACFGSLLPMLPSQGHIMRNPRIQPIFWDSSFAGSLTLQITMQLLTDMCAGTYFDHLDEYGVTLPPLLLPPCVITNDPPTGGSGSGREYEPGDLISLVQKWIANGDCPVAPGGSDYNLLYVLFCSPTANIDTGGSISYHTWGYYPDGPFGINFGRPNLILAVIPYPAQALAPGSSDLSYVNTVSQSLFHELAESFTDPDENGWLDLNGCEIADKCFLDTINWGPWPSQPYFVNSQLRCTTGPVLTPSSLTWVDTFWPDGNSQILIYRPEDGYWFIVFPNISALGFGFAFLDATMPVFGEINTNPNLFEGTLLPNTPGVAFQSSDGNWFMGSPSGDSTAWNNLTGGAMGFHKFGHTTFDDGLHFVGSFSVDFPQIAYYDRPSGNWQLRIVPSATNVHAVADAGNTGAPGSGLGDLTGYPWWTGAFVPTGFTTLLFYNTNDGSWWLGRYDFAQLQFNWDLAGNTLGLRPGDPNFGNVWDGRPFFQGQFNSIGQDQLMFFHGGSLDGTWWCATTDEFTSTMTWRDAGSTNTGTTDFRDVDGHLFFSGQFTSSGLDVLLVYSASDGNWYLGEFPYGGGSTTLAWYTAGNSGAPRKRVRRYPRLPFLGRAVRANGP
jgi:hypothetical protein